jgi:pyruvate formate lyase activating enzyme
MPFWKVTYNEKRRFATVHNYGCTFRCRVCSYKLRSGAEGQPGLAYPRPERFLSAPEIKDVLRSVSIDTLYFMGGEPTTATDLPEILAFGKNDLRVRTCLGHTNGSRLPLPNLDAANVGLKAWREDTHLAYTGREKKPIFDNVAAAFRVGTEIRANVVYIPGLVDLDQIESIARWLSELSPEIPFHVCGYIPVPGQTYVRPTVEQMQEAVAVCRRHLRDVDSSHLTPEEALDLTARDERFATTRLV